MNNLKHKLYKLLTQSEFLRNSSVLAGGMGVAVIIQILATPILTRFYSSQEFGVFALFFGIVNFLSIIMTAKYELTITLPKDDADSAALVLISMIISCFFSIIILFGSIIFVKVFKYQSWLYFVPFTCLLIGFFQSMYYWLVRQKNFKLLAKARVLHVFITVTISILSSFVLNKYWGLIIGCVFGYLFLILFLFISTIKKLKNYWINITEFTSLFTHMKRYKNFPFYSNISDAIDSFGVQFPTFFLSAFFGNSTVGFFSIAQTATTVPTNVISNAIGDVFRQKASYECMHKGECRIFFIKVFFLLSFFGGILFPLFFIVAPKLFEVIFGKEWVIAGEYARILTIMLFLRFIASPLRNMFIVAEKQKIDLMLRLYLCIATIIALYSGYYFFHSVKMCLLLLVIVRCINSLFSLFLSYRVSFGTNSNVRFKSEHSSK